MKGVLGVWLCTSRLLLAATVLIIACRPQAEEPRAASPSSGGSNQASAAASVSAAPPAPPPSASSPQVGDAGAASKALPPLRAPQRLVELEVSGFRPATVSLPLGATEPRPILVALHGNYDRPEWQCMVWGELVRYAAFVLCPRGIPRTDAPKSEDRWTYGALGATLKELYAGLRALREAYPDHADVGPAVFTGFSLGAILGVHALGPEPGSSVARERGEEPPFQHAILVEGGAEGWHARRATRFVAERPLQVAGAGVLFGCGQHACRQQGTRAARLLTQGGATAQVAFGGNVGHTYDGQVAAAIAEALPELLGSDPRWAPLLAAPEGP
ncbi:MAG: hypothetical protein KIT72_17325 [Polyangiaceae bacterium]|nr:hypothetical protein [Polyangiaceae bacterium]MCW5792176.1 hypothetical protein [Polyangiaceae bacterium]